MNAVLFKIAAGALLIAAAVFGWNWYIGSIESAADKRGYDRAQAEMTQKTLDAVNEVRVEEARRIKTLEGVVNDTRTQLATTRAAHAGAVAAGQRLRDEIARLSRRPAGDGAAPAAGGAPADPTGDLLADVRRRLDEAADATARFADEGRLAGQTCERLYESLRK
jgi:hypothetical protein